jgi:hypothetical protein
MSSSEGDDDTGTLKILLKDYTSSISRRFWPASMSFISCFFGGWIMRTRALQNKTLYLVCICSLFLSSYSCSERQFLFPEVRPKGYFSISSMPSSNHLLLNACVTPYWPGQVTPLLVEISNRSNTAWTLDASQISVARASQAAPTTSSGSKQWLPIPPDDAAQMSPVPWRDALASIIDRAGSFGANFAAIGAAGGALHAVVDNQNISDEAQIGAGAGFGLGIFVGSGV